MYLKHKNAWKYKIFTVADRVGIVADRVGIVPRERLVGLRPIPSFFLVALGSTSLPPWTRRLDCQTPSFVFMALINAWKYKITHSHRLVDFALSYTRKTSYCLSISYFIMMMKFIFSGATRAGTYERKNVSIGRVCTELHSKICVIA